MIIPAQSQPEVEYPDHDGNPMSENMLQFEWIVTLQGNLDALFRDNPEVLVAGDLLWYPVAGDNVTRMAPDAMVVFGRPKGYRSSYKQWLENNVSPQVVFEVLSPQNTTAEMARKREFYERHGAEEFYIYDPEDVILTGYLRNKTGELAPIPELNGFTSPRLGIRFDLNGKVLAILRPDGQPFLTFLETVEQLETLQKRASREAKKTTQALQRAQDAEQKLEQLRAQLRAAGLDPDAGSS